MRELFAESFRSTEASAEAATRAAGVITGVGYNYRWAPLVQYARQLIDAGELGEITNYRGRFFSMYGADPMGLLSWRFMLGEAGHGVSSDILSHSVDLAHMLIGGIEKVVGMGHIQIPERPLPKPGGTHYDVGKPGDPTGTVTSTSAPKNVSTAASDASSTPLVTFGVLTKVWVVLPGSIRSGE